MCLDVVREAAKEGSFHRPVQTSGLAAPDRAGPPWPAVALPPGRTGGMTTRRLIGERGKVGGSAKRQHTRQRHGRPTRSSLDDPGDGPPPERATRTGWRSAPRIVKAGVPDDGTGGCGPRGPHPPVRGGARAPRGDPAHLRVTVAPAPSSCSLAFSAAALSTFSRTGLGAPSTRSLASLRPREVSARTSLMTAIFLSPAASRTTSNSSCSSAAAASPPPAAGAPAAATATGSGGGDPEGLLELLDELGELDQGHLLEGVKELVGAELGHGGVLSVLRCREWRFGW